MIQLPYSQVFSPENESIEPYKYFYMNILTTLSGMVKIENNANVHSR